MGIKVLKDKYFTRKVDWKPVQKEEDYDGRGKGRKIVKKGKAVRNKNKNPQSYRIIYMQKEVPFLP